MRGVNILAGAVAAFLAIPAHAQEANWTGFYLGAEAGGGSSRLEASGADTIFQLTNINPPGSQPLTVVPGTTSAFSLRHSDTNFVYGGLAGFQLQSGQWVFGVEGDVHGRRDLADVSVTNALPATALAPAGTVQIDRSVRSDYDWSARARLGAALGETLLYVQGGVAGAQVRLRGQDTMSLPNAPAAATAGNSPFTPGAIGPLVWTASEKKSMIGWTAGIGGEQRITPMIGIGLDARYTDYGSHTFGLSGCFPNGAAQGQCAGETFSGGTITFPAGTAPASISPNGTDAYPGAAPSSTAVSLTDWRVTARLVLHFRLGG